MTIEEKKITIDYSAWLNHIDIILDSNHFKTAYGRVKIAEVAMTNIEGTIRIHTDGIVFNNQMTEKFAGLIKEDTTSCKINWKGVNNYPCLSSCSV